MPKHTFTADEGIDITQASGTVTISAEDFSATNKGLASFSTDNFSVTEGAVTIKNFWISNAELANPSITFSDGTNSSAVSLGRNH